jgi:hypothetical protein
MAKRMTESVFDLCQRLESTDALSIHIEKAKTRVRHPEPCQLDWQNGCGLASLVGSAHDAEAAQGSQPA